MDHRFASAGASGFSLPHQEPPAYRNPVPTADKGQFSVILENMNELRATLQAARQRLNAKVDVLLGQRPPQGGVTQQEGNGPAPNGVLQSMTWDLRTMIIEVQEMHDSITRIEQAGLGQ